MSIFSFIALLFVIPIAVAVFLPALLTVLFFERPALARKVLQVAGMPAVALVMSPKLAFPSAPLGVVFAVAGAAAVLSVLVGFLAVLIRSVGRVREQIMQEQARAPSPAPTAE